jgi:hypothetical protein
MSKSQKQTLAVGGVKLNVFSPLQDPGKATGRVAVLFLLHGRLSKADDLEATATKLVERSEDRRRSLQMARHTRPCGCHLREWNHSA